MKERRVAVKTEVRDVKLTTEIADARPLDLDDAGAHVGEAETRGRTRKELREIDARGDLQAASCEILSGLCEGLVHLVEN